VRIFRKNDDLRQLVEHERRRRALGTVVSPARPAEPPIAAEDATVAPVISLAAARARRVGHPSAGPGTDAPVTARH
jgi:hypothetical protein